LVVVFLHRNLQRGHRLEMAFHRKRGIFNEIPACLAVGDGQLEGLREQFAASFSLVTCGSLA
jgi:hypothetical protein